jgi:hypothetical protein
LSLNIPRDHNEAADAVRRHLLLGDCSAKEAHFEILRATVWSIATLSRQAHVNRVLGTALPTWRLLSERPAASDEELRTDLRDGLSMLRDAGDLIGLSGGYWVPATTRLVQLPDRSGNLIVGGVPTSSLPISSSAIRFHGPHRHLLVMPDEFGVALPREDFGSWTRRPEKGFVQEWAREVFESLERAAYTPSNADVFEFYLPGIARKEAPQFFRWNESAPGITGTVLARRRRLYGSREYRLVDVRAGEIVGACELHDIDVRRLMYALDLDSNNPVRARCNRVGTQTEWLFRSELPQAEQRAFAALGTLTINNDRHFERTWTFSRNEELVLEMLRGLGIAHE